MKYERFLTSIRRMFSGLRVEHVFACLTIDIIHLKFDISYLTIDVFC